MESAPNKRPKLDEDPDANCRLRNNLNVLCMAHIFQYLNTRDLLTLGGMNDFYQQIINDFVISNHNHNDFDINIHDDNVALTEFFRRHGSKIRKLHNIQLNESILQLIIQYCRIGQLKSVEFILTNFRSFHSDTVEQPCMHLRDVEKFMCAGPMLPINVYTFNMQFSSNLRSLKLSHINLDSNFDWNQLDNLNELHLDSVNGMNKSNFIQFLHQQSKLERFHQRYSLATDSRHDIYEAMAKYCNNQIRVLHDEMEPALKRKSYSFLLGLKSLKEIGFMYNSYCSKNLMYAFKMLAEIDTIETLVIHLRSHAFCNFSCVVRRKNSKIHIKQFTKLKTLRIYTNHAIEDAFSGRFTLNKHNKDPCSRIQLLIKYSAEILSHVETIEIIVESEFRSWDFLKFIPKMGKLYFVKGAYIPDDDHLWAAIAFDITSNLKMILQQRQQNYGHGNDSIELKCDDYFFVIFDRIINMGDSIKLIRMPQCEIERIRGPDVNFRIILKPYGL